MNNKLVALAQALMSARNAKHSDRPTIAQTLPAALEWLWKGYPIQ